VYKNILIPIFIVLISFLCGLKSTSQVILSENFGGGLNGWRVNGAPSPYSPHDWKWYATEGIEGSGGLRMKFHSDSNYIASPSVFLQAGKNYTVSFRTNVSQGSSTRVIKMGINSHRSPQGMDTLLSSSIPTNTYSVLPFTTFNTTATINVSGNYYFIWDYQPNGYLFTYFDDVIIEETNLPTATITSPLANTFQNENYVDSTKLEITANAYDADGTITFMEFYMNNVKVGTDSFPPYSISLKDLQPAQYNIKAKVIDNRGNVGFSPAVPYTVFMRDGLLKKYLQYDFDNDNPVLPNMEYWDLKNGDWRLRPGFHGNQSIENFSSYAGNLAVSTGFYLKKNEVFTLEYLATASSGNKPLHFFLTKNKSLTDSIRITTENIAGAENFNVIHTKQFSVDTSGVYYLGLHYPIVANFIQLKIDNIRIIGDSMSIAPIAKFIQPATSSIKTAENADINLKVNSFDIDGSVNKVEYFANQIKVAESSVAPNYNATWNDVPQGIHQLTARPIDTEGRQSISLPIKVETLANDFDVSSILGGVGNDEIRGIHFQKNGAMVIAANLTSMINSDIKKIYLNNANEDSLGALIRLSTDNKRIISLTRLSAKIADISADSADNIYVAAWSSGLIKVNASLDTIMWMHRLSNFAHRVDVSKSGKSICLTAQESDMNDGTLLGSGINTYLHGQDGNLMTTMGGIGQYGADVAIDDATQSVYFVGFKNFNTQGTLTNTASYPVFVPILRAKKFDNTTRFVGYDWESGITSPRWLNLSENNMADARLNRVVIGKDGNLYIAGQIYGGNHCFRYSPYNITSPVTVVGGDNFFNLSNTGTETHVYVGKLNPVTGEYLYGQTLTGRLPNGKGNSISIDQGGMEVDENGKIYLAGSAAFGLPLTMDHLPGEYTGGAYFIKLNAAMNVREECIRMNLGSNKAVAVFNSSRYAFGGNTNDTENIYLQSSYQTNNNSTSPTMSELSWSMKNKTLCPNTNLESSATGNWTINSTWNCPQVPQALHDVIINPNHIITLPINTTSTVWKVTNKGQFILENGAMLKILK
jgi:hypothetical protein